jgi:hypothetical protein
MKTASHAWSASRRRAGGVLLVLALLVSLVVATRAITDEGSFFLKGDPPRYLMNGVFLYDWLGSTSGWRLADMTTYAERYYARYPALSLGHHMPLLPVTLVPFYAAFGVSVFSARLAILTCFVLAVVLLYRLVTRLYDENVAGWACVLFASSPIIGSFGQRVLSEMPTIALVLAALNVIGRFRESGRLRDYLLVITIAAASLFSRPTAAYMFPAYGAFLIMHGGASRFRQRGILMATLLGATLITVAALAISVLAPFNAAVVGQVVRQGLDGAAAGAVLEAIFRERPLFVAAVCGGVAALANRDARIMAAAVWIASVLMCAVVLTGAIEPGRYSILAVPAYCIAAASVTANVSGWPWYATSAALLVVAGLQFQAGLARPTLAAPGYETAARYVASLEPTPTILYSASIDTGYFVFFVRKHDPQKRLVILRSDKLLTTSLMAQLSVEDRIQDPSDIYAILRRYGTRFIVIEDRPSGSIPLDWLRDELVTDRFVERKRFPIGDGAPELRGVSLAVYEYREAVQPEPGVELDLSLPVARRRIKVSLSDLDVADRPK